MKKIGLVVKNDRHTGRKADAFENWLQAQGVATVRKKSLAAQQRSPGEPPAPSDLFCTFVLGGDGTFLSAVRWIGDQPIPILGVKFGDVGFLAETAAEDLYVAAEAILAGNFETTPRMRLRVEVLQPDRPPVRESVLNDVVINKGALARLASIETFVDDRYLTTYRADGLIVATPTGSTAYSLAAGGPIVHPAVPAIILTPICPFTLTNRPLIVPDTVKIKINLAAAASDIMLTFDGQAGMAIDNGVTIAIAKGAHPVNLITLPGQGYFDVLKTKLRWSGGRS